MFRNRTVDAVAGRISRRRGRRCMTTGGAFTASTGNSCCGIGESFWNEASPTPMKREACGVLLARTGECSQARADSPWRVQSVTDHAAAVRQGHAAGLAGILGRRPADGVAVLDRDPCARCTGKHIAANAPIFTCRARHHCCPVRGAVTKLLPPRAARQESLTPVVYVGHPPLSRFGTYGEAQEQHRRGTRDLLAFGEFE